MNDLSHTKMTWTFGLIIQIILFVGCSESPSHEPRSLNFQKVGSFAAHYDPTLGVVDYQPIDIKSATGNGLNSRSLGYADSTGLTSSAIRDTSKNPGDVNYEMGLVDPDSCSTDYNSTTKVLSFYAKLVNKSDLPNSAPYTYTNVSSFPPNTTYYTPFHFVITGLDWDTGTYPDLITAVNTNLTGASCNAQNGLTLATCDGTGIYGESSPNNRFDSIWPDNPVSDYTGLPGWDFSSYVSANNMTPGEDTGCVLFMQYTLTENQSFTIYFDLLGVKDDGTLPPQPTVTAPAASTSYVNTSTINVTITNCAAGRTLYIEGGASTASGACTGASKTVAVTLNQNTENTLSIYQVNDTTLKQSQSVTRTVIHDNIAPTLVASNPATGELGVDINSNCIFTFSEPMNTSTFTTGTNCTNGTFTVCRSTTFLAGAISFSTDGTQAIYNPTAAMNVSAAHTCTAKTGITDVAGNALASNQTASFTTRSAALADLTKPFIKSIYPADNATIPTSAAFTIYFNEPVDPASLTATDCDDAGIVPNINVWQTNACPLVGAPSRPNPINGTISLNATGDVVTFTPSTAIQPNDCLVIMATACVKDLAGNTMPIRSTSGIGAYPASNVDFSYWNVFYTSAVADSTAPILVHTGPLTGASPVPLRNYPFYVFNEPMDTATLIGDYFYANIFGSGSKISAAVLPDQTQQVVFLAPSANLNTSTNYVATTTGNAADVSGNLINAPQTFNFTTAASADSTAPTILSVTPVNGSSVSKCTTIDIRFSEAMDKNTLNPANVYLQRVGGSQLKTTTLIVSDNGKWIRMIPDSSLQSSSCGGGSNNCRYRPVITTGVKDRNGNALAATYNSTSFLAIGESTAPTVTAFVPANGSAVSQNGNFAVFFSEPMDRTTLINSNFTVAGTDCPFQSVFPSLDGTSVVINCYNKMSTSAAATLTAPGATLRDAYNATNAANCEAQVGNTLGTNQTLNFSVSASSDTTKPTVSSVSPADGDTSVSTSIVPTITFSENLDPRSVVPTSVFLVDQYGDIVDTVQSYDLTAGTSKIRLTPVTALLNPGIYYIIATTALMDLGGNNTYDGDGGENVSVPGILRTCFSTNGTACP